MLYQRLVVYQANEISSKTGLKRYEVSATPEEDSNQQLKKNYQFRQLPCIFLRKEGKKEINSSSRQEWL